MTVSISDLFVPVQHVSADPEMKDTIFGVSYRCFYIFAQKLWEGGGDLQMNDILSACAYNLRS